MFSGILKPKSYFLSMYTFYLYSLFSFYLPCRLKQTKKILHFDDLLFIISLILMKSFNNRRVITEWDVIYLVNFIFIECRLDQALFETSWVGSKQQSNSWPRQWHRYENNDKKEVMLALIKQCTRYRYSNNSSFLLWANHWCLYIYVNSCNHPMLCYPIR